VVVPALSVDKMAPVESPPGAASATLVPKLE
jgi:hypothetical protein